MSDDNVFRRLQEAEIAAEEHSAKAARLKAELLKAQLSPAQRAELEAKKNAPAEPAPAERQPANRLDAIAGAALDRKGTAHERLAEMVGDVIREIRDRRKSK